MWFAAGCLAVATLGFAAIPGGAFVWAVCTGVGLGTVFPICLTMCLDTARVPAEAGAAAALMFLAGYPIAALGPLVAGGLRDLTGAFDASLWTLVALAALTAAVIVAFQLSLTHWFYLYLPWMLPFVVLWLVLPAERAPAEVEDYEIGMRSDSIAVALPDSESESMTAPSIRTSP
jgi:MFS family permease